MSEPPSAADLVAQLKTNSFFLGLSDDVLRELADQALWRSYDPGEMVFLEGEPALGLYVLHTGWLKIVTHRLAQDRQDLGRWARAGATISGAR